MNKNAGVSYVFPHFSPRNKSTGGLQAVLRLKEGTAHRICQRACTCSTGYPGGLDLDLKIPFTKGMNIGKLKIKGMNFRFEVNKCVCLGKCSGKNTESRMAFDVFDGSVLRDSMPVVCLSICASVVTHPEEKQTHCHILSIKTPLSIAKKSFISAPNKKQVKDVINDWKCLTNVYLFWHTHLQIFLTS